MQILAIAAPNPYSLERLSNDKRIDVHSQYVAYEAIVKLEEVAEIFEDIQKKHKEEESFIENLREILR